MTHHRRPFVTLIRTRLRGCGPISLRNKKINRHSLVCLFAQPRSSVATHPSAPFPTAHCRIAALCPSPVTGRAARPRSIRCSPMSQSPAPLTYVPVTCAARSLAVYSSPIVVGRAADPAMAAGDQAKGKGTHERCRCCGARVSQL
jgi:hypothetical protein